MICIGFEGKNMQHYIFILIAFHFQFVVPVQVCLDCKQNYGGFRFMQHDFLLNVFLLNNKRSQDCLQH